MSVTCLVSAVVTSRDACSHLGASVATVKDHAGLENIKRGGAKSVTGVLTQEAESAPYLRRYGARVVLDHSTPESCSNL